MSVAVLNASGITAIERCAQARRTQTASIEIITPEKAAKWLATSKGNRRAKSAKIFQYRSDIAGHSWDVNGQTIVFDSDTALIDGHNRLTACVESGTAFASWVIRGVEFESRVSIDTGAPRKFSDVLTLNGEKSTNALAAAARFAWRYFNRKADGSLATSNPSGHQQQIVLDNHPLLRESVLPVNTAALRRLLRPSVAIFSHYMFGRVDEVLRDAFFSDLESGTSLPDGSPALALRENLIRNRTGRAATHTDVVAALIVKAWNAEREGRKVKFVVWRSASEPFPEIK
jgi:hypothetical protein